MKIGLPGDRRKFQRRKPPGAVTEDIEADVTPLRKCHVCQLKITGKYWRVAKDKFECHRCHNE